MAIDSAQKRMSAVNVSCPWRGPLVDAPEASFSAGNRQAAAYLYSGITADAPAVVTATGLEYRSLQARLHQSAQSALRMAGRSNQARLVAATRRED